LRTYELNLFELASRKQIKPEVKRSLFELQSRGAIAHESSSDSTSADLLAGWANSKRFIHSANLSPAAHKGAAGAWPAAAEGEDWTR